MLTLVVLINLIYTILPQYIKHTPVHMLFNNDDVVSTLPIWLIHTLFIYSIISIPYLFYVNK